jgi:hypothetical protein
VLRVFSGIADIAIDLAELDHQAREMEPMHVEHLRRLQAAAEAASRGQNEQEVEGEEWRKPKSDEISPHLKARIETLFAKAHQDRSKALELKAELDRHGVFRRYEDRFLDLFKHGA